MRNSSGQQGENELQCKNANGNTSDFFVSTYDMSSIKRVTRKFHVVVAQNNSKEMDEKVCCTCKVFFFFAN